jgi:hypothetical protein
MSAFVDSLNLRPQEKRVIVVIGVVVFVTLNFWFVFPQFKEKARIEKQLKTTHDTLITYQSKIAMDNSPSNGYLKRLDKLQKMEGGEADKFGADIMLQTAIAAQARSNGVNVQAFDPVNTYHIGPTNTASQFFESQTMSITAMAKEESLVKFLYNVGNDAAMIRVKDLSLNPADANRYELKCRITLTADYKKSSATKAAAPKVEAPLMPSAKLATAPAPKPAPPGAGPARPAPTNVGPAKAAPPAGNQARPQGPAPFPTIPRPSQPRALLPGPNPVPAGRTN